MMTLRVAMGPSVSINIAACVVAVVVELRLPSAIADIDVSVLAVV